MALSRTYIVFVCALWLNSTRWLAPHGYGRGGLIFVSFKSDSVIFSEHIIIVSRTTYSFARYMFQPLQPSWTCLTPPSFVQSKSNFRLFGGELCLFVHWGHIPQTDAVLTLRFFKIWSVFWLFGMKIIWSPPVANLIMYTWNGACNWHFQWIWNRIDVSRADSRGSCYEGLCTVRLLLTMHYACEDVVVSP